MRNAQHPSEFPLGTVSLSWHNIFMAEFKTTMTIHFDEADPAGIAFAGQIFTKVHRCYEDFIAHLRINKKHFFLDSDYAYPIKSFEAEYLAPLFPLQTYDVNVSVLNLSQNSYQLQFNILDGAKSLCLVRSVHVCCKKQPFEKSPLPIDLKSRLENYLSHE